MRFIENFGWWVESCGIRVQRMGMRKTGTCRRCGDSWCINRRWLVFKMRFILGRWMMTFWSFCWITLGFYFCRCCVCGDRRGRRRWFWVTWRISWADFGKPTGPRSWFYIAHAPHFHIWRQFNESLANINATSLRLPLWSSAARCKIGSGT